MELLDELAAEHILIEQMLGSLRTYVAQRCRGEAPRADADRFITFFRVYAGAFHHEREEQVLFPALIEEAGLPADRGPVTAILTQHRDMERIITALGTLLTGELDREEDRHKALELADAYYGALTVHIDAENSVMFPESEHRLQRSGVFDLPTRPLTPEEEAARQDGEELVALYPPTADPSVIRGEGCVICPSFGAGCDGVEREWWSDLEWEEFPDRL